MSDKPPPILIESDDALPSSPDSQGLSYGSTLATASPSDIPCQLEVAVSATNLSNAQPPANVAGAGDVFPSEQEATSDGVFYISRNSTRTLESGESEIITEHIRVKRCPKCKEAIPLSQGKGLNTFDAHIGKSKCKSTMKANRNKESQQSITSFLVRPETATSTPTLEALFVPPKDSTLESLAGSQSHLMDLTLDESTPPISPASSMGPRDVHAHLDPDNSDHWISTDVSLASSLGFTCSGLEFIFGESMYLQYPWHLHHFNELPYHFLPSRPREPNSAFAVTSVMECLVLDKPFARPAKTLIQVLKWNVFVSALQVHLPKGLITGTIHLSNSVRC